jgi:demethylmenaquinone methyltransferase/2-methoxy-6-polyprenyl-1,4-benzoquinol methylase
MRRYYEQRAPEYDDWWHGSGLFAERDRAGWDEEVQALCAALRALPPARTLDVGCGTGFLTAHLPGDVTGLDQSAGMLAIASERRPDARFVLGDGLAPPFPDGAFERVHSAHFYGHLDEEQRRRFLAAAERLAGELIVVDSALRPGGGAEEWQERELMDGSRHRVYKRWFTPEGLREELGGGDALFAGEWFVAVRRRSRRPTSAG